jgi:glyoxylate/hydroxypyruvate reductase A
LRHLRIHVTPHIAAQTLIDDAAAQFAGKIAAIARGEPVSGVVDPARHY